jgi:6-pyruvoyltetrahydropterin/6-carboxytetrahydropterin synthase
VYRTFVETHFTSAHQLHGYQGHCGRLHGHTWKVRVDVETDRVDAIGISIDFQELKRIIHIPISKLDHFHINEIPPFDKKNPTAEHLSEFIYREIKANLARGITLRSVTVWESDHFGVEFHEP